MSNAEDKALKKYPKKIEWVGNQWDGAPFDVNSEKRFYYQQGYKEAEKDLELTWEDVQNIRNIISEMMVESYTRNSSCSTHEEFSKEVLKRFKEIKK